MDKLYDVIIIGSGPAGMTAAIYARRFNLSVLVFENNAPGGAMVNTEEISNYPGFNTITGVDLSMQIYMQMMNLNVDYQGIMVSEISKTSDKEIIVKGNGLEFRGKSVIIATGTRNKTLGLDSEKKFFYRGISWCAICDGPLYKDKDVAVIGGGNSALSAALSLSKFVNKVYLIHRRDYFKGEKILVDKVLNNPKIELVLNSNVLEFHGENALEEIVVSDNLENIKNIKISGCFEEIGRLPNTSFLQNIELSKDGYILVDEDYKTSIDGIYACGDVVDKKVRQIATAVNDGAIAAIAINKYLG